MDEDYMVSQYLAGKSSLSIAKDVGCSDATVRNKLRRRGVQIRDNSFYKDYPVKEDFFNEWSSDMAYILGFSLADACIETKNKSPMAVRYDLSEKDVEILEFIRNKISPTRPIQPSPHKDKRTNKTYRAKKLVISSKLLSRSLVDRGILPDKTGIEEIPSDVPDCFMPDFLRGLFDGDGCWFLKKYEKNSYLFDLPSSSEKLVNQVLDYIGLGYVKPDGNVFRFRTAVLDEIVSIGNVVYNGNFCLKRKYDTYLKIKRLRDGD